MRSTLLTFAILAPSPGLAQELIPNGDFETYTSCPTGPSQLFQAVPWLPPTTGTADYFHACNTTPGSVGVPSNDVGTQEAWHGNGYAGFILLVGPGGANDDYREYIQAPLNGSPLEAGKTYRYSMHVSLAEKSSAATDRIGAYFSDTPVSSSTNDPLPFTPQIETPAGTFLTDLVEWMDYTDTFVADGGEQFVTIGNFHDASSAGSIPAGTGPTPPLQMGVSYYYIDGVSLKCEPCLEPPMDMTAWWPLDETTGPLASDIVNAQDGSYVDSPVPTTGYVDGGLDFLASSLSVPSTAWLEHSNADLSMDAWIRADALGTDQTLFSKVESVTTVTDPGYAIRLNADGTIRVILVDDSLTTVTADSTGVVTPGEWTFIAVTVDRDDPSGGKLFVNDTITTFDPTAAPDSLSNSLPLLFATDGGAGVGGDFIGGMDEVEVFHRALAISEVAALYQARTSGKCKTELEVPTVTPVPIVSGTVTVAGTLTNGTGATGTYTIAATADPPRTQLGPRKTTIAGPSMIRVLGQQPLQLGPGQSVPVIVDMDVPAGLGGGELASYTLTVTHNETGRTFIARGGLQGRYPRIQKWASMTGGLRDASRR